MRRGREKSSPSRITPPARRKGRPNETSQETVGADTLIEVAGELLRTAPPEKITRAMVARAANVDPTLIRYYFSNTHSLLRAAAVMLSTRFRELAAMAMQAEHSPEDKLRARIRTFLEFQMAYPFYHRLMIGELWESGDAEARALLMQVSAAGAVGYEKIIQQGVAEGRMRAVDPILFHFCVIGFVELAAMAKPILRANKHRAANSNKYVAVMTDFITDLLVNGLKS